MAHLVTGRALGPSDHGIYTREHGSGADFRAGGWPTGQDRPLGRFRAVPGALLARRGRATTCLPLEVFGYLSPEKMVVVRPKRPKLRVWAHKKVWMEAWPRGNTCGCQTVAQVAHTGPRWSAGRARYWFFLCHTKLLQGRELRVSCGKS